MNKAVLKGRYIIAQGNPDSSGVALGCQMGKKIVREIRITIEKFLFRTKELNPISCNNSIQFRPEEVFRLKHHVLADGFRYSLYSQGDVSDRSSRDLPWAMLFRPFRPVSYSAQLL